MGLGTTKKKRVAYTAIQRMIEDDAITDSNRLAILRYLIENEGKTSASINSKTIPDYIIDAKQSSIVAKMDRAYNYAASGSYTYGLPTAANVSFHGFDITPVVKAYIESSLGYSVSMLYCNIGDANYSHFLWKKLIDAYGYNPTTNEITALSSSEGFPCYLKTAKLYYGIATVSSDETGETLKQYGLSTESGQCLTRSQDLNRPAVAIDVNTNVQDAYVDVTYQYIEIVPDTVAPPMATVNTLTFNTIDGYAEKGSSVSISVNSVFTINVGTDSTGYFTHTFSTALIVGDIVTILVTDEALNSSAALNKTVPYTNTSPATTGSDKTVIEITHTKYFTFNFVGYISSAVPIIPAEPDDPPTVVVGSDDYVPDYDYIQASYTYNVSGATHVGYLTYAYGTNTVAALEDLFNTSNTSGEFYPRLYTRLNQQDLPNTLSPSSNEYKTSSRMGSLMGIDWKDLSKSLHESVEDIQEVHQMFVGLAIPMNTNDPALHEYLYRYWFKTYQDINDYITDPLFPVIGGKKGQTIKVEDSVYTHYVSFEAIAIISITGSIGATGTYAHEYVNEYQDATNSTYEANTGNTEYSQQVFNPYPSYHSYKHQINATTYTEVRVYSSLVSHSFSGLTTSAVGDDPDLLIPLDRTATLYMTGKEKEILYSKCLYLFVNLVKIIKIKWYQREGFRIVINIIALIIIIMSKGSATKLAIALIKLAIVNIAIRIIIRLLIKLGVREDIASAVGAVLSFMAGSGVDSIQGLTSMTALQTLQALSTAFNIYTKTYEYRMKALIKESEDFYINSKEKEEELKQARALLDTDTISMDLQLLLKDARSTVFIKLGESPDEFMYRNPINVTNLTVNYIENYVAIMMQPPNLNTMLNQIKRGDDYV